MAAPPLPLGLLLPGLAWMTRGRGWRWGMLALGLACLAIGLFGALTEPRAFQTHARPGALSRSIAP